MDLVVKSQWLNSACKVNFELNYRNLGGLRYLG